MLTYSRIEPLFNLLKRTRRNLSTSNISYISPYLNELEGNDQNDKTNIKFNSVLDGKLNRFSFLQRRKKLIERQQIDRIQPLPLSLKFLLESDSTNRTHENPVPKSYNNSNKLQFPYSSCNSPDVDEIHHNEKNTDVLDASDSINKEIRLRNENLQLWMNSYGNLECDVTANQGTDNINYGTPDPKSTISEVPCGGCGAFLHCKDTAIPGYIPSEIFKNTNKMGAERLEAIICQRCFFLKEHNIALNVRVSADDYPKVLMTINNKKALVVLMVDLTDFPCSIWPGIADILGPKTNIFVVGNKVDLLPKDDAKFLTHIKHKLYDQIKICGFGTSNILNVSLVSAKTGYGVEELITSLQKMWQAKDVYLVGCTNVGKSSLFNSLLQSDYCKFQTADLIQRATTSQWPGTTLNLLKFPIMRVSAHRLYARTHRIIETNRRLAIENERREEQLKAKNTVENATLIGRIERTFSKHYMDSEKADSFITQPNINDTGLKIGLRENHPDFSSGRWCYDTPGVVHPDQILDLLTLDELVLTLPKELIRPETFCVKPGSTLFVAGLARLDYLSGPDSVRLTVFRSNELPVTICNIDVADETYNDCLGTELFRVPQGATDRLEKWPNLQASKIFTIQGTHKLHSSKDVVLSNAGWIAVTCSPGTEFTFQAWTPEKRGIHIRDCILSRAVTLRGKRIRGSVAYGQHKFI